MKLRNYFLLSIVVGAASACSSDDVPDIPVVRVPDAMLSLAIGVDGNLSTKGPADVENTNLVTLDEQIKSLHVFVFNSDGTFMSGKDSTLTHENEGEQNVTGDTNKKFKTANQVLNIPVLSGNAKVLVIANGKTSANNYTGTLNDLCLIAKATSLDEEVAGFYTMSSRVMNVSVAVDKTNCMGYTTSEIKTKDNGQLTFQENGDTDAAVKLYRSVSKVRFGNLTIKETTKDNIGTPVKFVLDTVFVANVKGLSLLASNSENAGWGGSLNAAITDKANWWYGAYPDGEGEYKVIEGTQKGNLLYAPNPDNVPSKIFAVEPGTTKTKTVDCSFQVYENQEGMGAQTLLIVRGDYTYIPQGGTVADAITEYDRFYTIPVNQVFEGSTSDFASGLSQHSGIRRNIQYNINLTITGTGSTKPYDKDATACINVAVEVEKWGVVHQDETLE